MLHRDKHFALSIISNGAPTVERLLLYNSGMQLYTQIHINLADVISCLQNYWLLKITLKAYLVGEIMSHECMTIR